MFSHLPVPICQLYYLLPPVTSVIPVFFHQSLLSYLPLIPPAQVSLGLPRFLLPGRRHFIILLAIFLLPFFEHGHTIEVILL
jgi:hypothetical protein